MSTQGGRPALHAGTTLSGCRLDEPIDALGQRRAWRAHDASGTPVVLTVTAMPDDADVIAATTGRVEDYRLLAHPGLVHVRGVSSTRSPSVRDNLPAPGEWIVTVSDAIDGSTLVDWLAAHPDADAVQITRLLRMVASALDTLHTAGLSHGGLDAEHVIVGDDGTATLTEPRWLPTIDGGHEPGWARPEAIGSDRRAFLLTVVHALTGEQAPTAADGSLDVTELRRRLYTAASLRRRPAFAAQLVHALTAPADTLTAKLRPWLDSAAAAGAQDTVTGRTGPAAAEGPGVPPSNRRALTLLFAGGGVAIVVATVIAILIAAAPTHHPKGNTPSLGIAGISTSAAPPAAAPSPVQSAATWLAGGSACNRTTAVAMPLLSGPRTNLPADPREDVLAAGGAIWHQGQLTITLRNTTPRNVVIIRISPRTFVGANNVSPPAWIYRPSGTGTCTGATASGPTRHYTLNAVDMRDFRSDAAIPADPLGPPLSIPTDQTATLTITTTACGGNARFGLRIAVVEEGSSATDTVLLPLSSGGSASYAIDGIADHTDVFEGPGANPVGQLTGTDPACPRTR